LVSEEDVVYVSYRNPVARGEYHHAPK
jgi:hypothetical protein